MTLSNLKRAPAGFHIVTKNTIDCQDNYCDNDYPEELVPTINFNLFDANQNIDIGYVVLVKTARGAYETHSEIERKYRGQGLGTILYAKAFHYGLNHKLKIVSSLNPSKYAQRVWNSRFIRNQFMIAFSSQRYFVYGRK